MNEFQNACPAKWLNLWDIACGQLSDSTGSKDIRFLEQTRLV